MLSIHYVTVKLFTIIDEQQQLLQYQLQVLQPRSEFLNIKLLANKEPPTHLRVMHVSIALFSKQ